MRQIIRKILYKLHILKRPAPPSKVEQWRARGVTIGKNFDAPDSAIDYCFGHLVTIGDNVTISGTTILAHDGSTKNSWVIVRLDRLPLAITCLLAMVALFFLMSRLETM